MKYTLRKTNGSDAKPQVVSEAYVCDVCGEQYERLKSYRLPVKLHMYNEWGTEEFTDIQFKDFDLCDKCLDKVVLIEEDSGLVSDVPKRRRIGMVLTDSDTQVDQLRDWCKELLGMAIHHDPEWFHWPEASEELRKLGCDV